MKAIILIAVFTVAFAASVKKPVVPVSTVVPDVSVPVDNTTTPVPVPVPSREGRYLRLYNGIYYDRITDVVVDYVPASYYVVDVPYYSVRNYVVTV